MKKVFISTLSFLLVLVNLKSQVVFQSDFESWTDGKPDGWFGTVTSLLPSKVKEYTTSVQSGQKACQIINDTTFHRRLSTQPLSTDGGTSYNFVFYARGKGDIRVGIFSGDTTYTYSSYKSINTQEWQKIELSVIAPKTSNNSEFILSIKATDAALDHIQVDNLTVSKGQIDVVKIKDIQYTTQANGDSPYKDKVVTTYGTVTAVAKDGYFIQDGTGAWSGLYIYDKKNKPEIGDSVEIKGTVVEYYNFTEINATTFNKIGKGKVPAPFVIKTKDVNSEDYEAVLIKVHNAVCKNPSAGYGMWVVDDGSGECKVHNLIYAYSPVLNAVYNITGPIYYSFNEFRIEPRFAQDIEVTTSIENSSSETNIRISDKQIYISEKIVEVKIFDITGRNIITTNQNTVSISDLNKGLYLMQVSFTNQQKTTVKFLKQ